MKREYVDKIITVSFDSDDRRMMQMIVAFLEEEDTIDAIAHDQDYMDHARAACRLTAFVSRLREVLELPQDEEDTTLADGEKEEVK